MSCPHLSQLSTIPNPRLSQSVHREECTQCFDDQDLPEGIDVCLTCFNGGCVGDDRKHAQIHVQKSGHPYSLNIKRRLKRTVKRDSAGPPPKKLAILEEREEDKYEWQTTLRCWTCEPDGKLLPGASSDSEFQRLCTAVMQSMSSARQSEVKAWEEEIIACEHTLTLQQESTGPIPASGLAHCAKCELKENLWLCLTCGSLGCGRQQYGGIGGNGHGLQHFTESKHPVSVKLGTITPEGTADIYCYICDDSKLDPDMALHLSSFGINVAAQSKTEKSITELQIEHNLKFDFSMTAEDGKALDPVFGPGLTGLRNLGNTCYMASTLQVLFCLPAFRTIYFNALRDHSKLCQERMPADCLDCQMFKIADGLLSGRYSVPRSGIVPTYSTVEPMTVDGDLLSHPGPVFQEGLKPGMFKALVGKGHEEFSTMRQQDAQEFFTHLIKLIRQRSRKVGSTAADEIYDPTEVFKFGMEQRLQCLECAGVRYRVDGHDLVSLGVPAVEDGKDEDGKTSWKAVRMIDCLEVMKAGEEIEYRCPRCAKNVMARKQTTFATFPEILIIQAMKFQTVGWVPGSKVDIPVDLPEKDILILDDIFARGLQPGEEPLPDDEKSAPAMPSFNEAALEQLQSMGFPVPRCQKALLATGNEDAEAAMNWLFEHMDDPDIDTPFPSSSAGVGQTKSKPKFEPSSQQVDMVCEMGFTPIQARKALTETEGNIERAVDWLFNHMGEDISPAQPTSSTEENQAASATPHVGGTSTLPARFRLKAFISHKGPSVHSGHYVAHIRVGDGNNEEGEWALFNDEKVVKADLESVGALKRLAYLFVFERV